MREDDKSTVLIFFINGIQSLLAWNAVLAAFDFFANSFKDYNVYSLMPVALFAGELLVALAFHQTSNRFTYFAHIMTGNLISSISLLLLLLVSLLLQQQLLGFLLVLLISFIIGIGANLTQLTFFAMINYLSQEVVSKFSIGIAFSGLFISITRAILTSIFGSDNPSSTPTIIYFAIAISLISLDLVLNYFFCKSQVYKLKIDRFLLHHDKEKQISRASQSNIKDEQQKINQNFKHHQDKSNIMARMGNQEPPILPQEYLKIQAKIQTQNYFKTLYQTSKTIPPYPFLIFLNFLITFTLYPGPCFSKKVGNLDSTWCVIIYNIAFNVGDTLGRYLCGIQGFFNHQSAIYTLVLRLFFFFPVTVMAIGADIDDLLLDNQYFPFISMFLFAFTNGIVLSMIFSIIDASFILSFKKAPLAYKKYAGVLCGLMLQIGIMLGTAVQIPYAIILGIY